MTSTFPSLNFQSRLGKVEEVGSYEILQHRIETNHIKFLSRPFHPDMSGSGSRRRRSTRWRCRATASSSAAAPTSRSPRKTSPGFTTRRNTSQGSNLCWELNPRLLVSEASVPTRMGLEASVPCWMSPINYPKVMLTLPLASASTYNNSNSYTNGVLVTVNGSP